MRGRLVTLLPVVLIFAGALYGFSKPAESDHVARLLGYTVQLRTQQGASVYQPADNVWYAPGALHLTVQPGTWRLSYRVCTYVSRSRNADGSWDTGTVSAVTTLSTSPVAETDPDLRAFYRVGGAERNAVFVLSAEKVEVLKRPTTFWLLAKQSEGEMGELQFAAGNENCNPTLIRAERVG